ncbi:putative holin [Methylophilus sp. DW102]|uniref:putative holin n=1 Tax=Methylophilus sp. DW102 TaxID=3095607 RepID=UPI003088C570|nr:putative holin [Methylophilus sp. DW102]
MQRHLLLISFNLILLGAVLFFAPQQVPVTLYKLSLVTLAALVGFWLDRLLFPYARPDQVMGRVPSNSWRCVDNRETVFSACLIRRAIIVGCAMLAMGLGA